MNIARKALIGIIASAGIALAGFGFGAHYKDIQWSLKWEARNLADSKAAHEAEKQERAKEQAWADAVASIGKKAHEEIEDVRKRERANADRRVRNTIADYANRASKEACVVDGGASDSIEVLAELLDRVHEFAERSSAEADEARARGLACQQEYDATR